MKQTRNFINFSLAGLLTMASALSAAVWTGNGDGTNWSDAANWDTNAVPGNTTAVLIDGNSNVTFPSGNMTRQGITALKDNASLTMTSGRFLQGGDSNAANFTVADNASFQQISGDYFIVGLNSVSKFNQLGGTVDITVNRGFFMTDGTSASGSTFNLKDGNLSVHFVNYLSDWNADFPGHSGAQGYFTMSGGTAEFTNELENSRDVWVRYGSKITINGGEIAFNNFNAFVIGRLDNTDTEYPESTVTINNGKMTLAEDTGALIVGGSNSSGTLVVNGGILNANSMRLGNGGGCPGAHVYQNGGDITLNGTVTLGIVAEAIDTQYIMSAGTLTADNILLGDNAADTVEFVLNGGIITLNGNQSSLVDEDWFAAQAGTVVEYDSVNDITVISRIPFAHNPVPASGSVDFGTPADNSVEVTLKWNTGLGTTTATAGIPNPDITSHMIYFSTDKDPNEYLLDEIAVNGNATETVTYGPLDLEYDTTYYWHVDEMILDASTNEPNAVTGGSWFFSTPASVPVITDITSDSDTDMYFAGDTMVITASFKSVSDVTSAAWYLNDSAISTSSNVTIETTAATSTLTVTAFDASFIGNYKCVVTSTAGDSKPSAVVAVDMKRLVAWYEFENDLTDSANGSNGRTDDASSFTYSAGIDTLGQALTLTSANQARVYIPRPVDKTFTMTFWVKTDLSNASGDWSDGIGLVDGDMTGVLDDYGSSILNGKFAFGVGNLNITLQSNNTINDNLWHFCVATRNADTGRIELYVDGEYDNSATGPKSTKNAAAELVIGSINTGDSDNYLGGQIDDVKFYNFVLTEMEVADMFIEVTGKPVCVQSMKPSTKYDINDDCIVNVADFAIFAGQWLESGLYNENTK